MSKRKAAAEPTVLDTRAMETARALAALPTGTTPLNVEPLTGARLSVLVPRGWASKVRHGRLGDFRYQITPAGLSVLATTQEPA